MRYSAPIIIVILALLSPLVSARESIAQDKNSPQLLQRTILALYDSRVEPVPFETLTHKFIEAPLNYLGLSVEYQDISKGFPSNIFKQSNIRGVLSCFPRGMRIEDPDEYISWAKKAIGSGLRLVVMCDPGIVDNSANKTNSKLLLKQLLEPLGVNTNGDYIQYTPELLLSAQSSGEKILEFEGPAPPTFLPILQTNRISNRSKVLLHAVKNMEAVDLIVIGQHGAYAAQDTAFIREIVDSKQSELRWWYINPFIFLREAFSTQELPIPDPTSYIGRRVSYIIVSGSASNESAPNKISYSIYNSIKYTKQIIEEFPNLLFTAAPVVGEIDDRIVGSMKVKEEISNLFALENVEAASNTYNDIWEWGYYNQNNNPGRAQLDYKDFVHNWPRPSRYDVKSFDLNTEIKGSIDYLKALAKDKANSPCLVWSGDKRPFNEAIEYVQKNSICSIGGGTSRIDPMHPSYAWLQPLSWSWNNGSKVPYLSLSDEADFINQTGTPYSYIGLKESLDRTRYPYHIKPISIGFQFNSTSNLAQANILKELLRHLSSLELFPVSLSQYLALVDGFFTVQFERCGDDCWLVRNRGRLNTIRFDGVSNKSVDIIKSLGVVGYKEQNGSLSVSLDPSYKNPKIVLSASSIPSPSFVESTWEVTDVKITNISAKFIVEGYSSGKMSLRVPWKDSTRIVYHSINAPLEIIQLEQKADASNIVSFPITFSKKQRYIFEVSQDTRT